ncbi:hypothetical protein [Aliidiomarina quisquiliarum]|uniref:hypothetical protein n=1 Tax=Aliidiomarina quisquiliarum TaxID=2938947 RepID=UPI00208FB31E|nr:hypothetical protein [Aliidiomarina quisquiliarum]MCO4321765.1 hypothetical protein [Aliidiomarina quisquiliarum]
MSTPSKTPGRIPLWFWLPAVLGLIAAFATWWLMGLYIEQKVEERPRLPALPVEEHQVIVPREDLLPGVTIELEHLAIRQLAAAALPTDVFFGERVEEVVGRVVISHINRGKAIQELHLVEQSSQTLSEQIAKGHTAFTLPLEASWTHAHSIQNGDVFDFYAADLGRWRRLLSSVRLISLAPQLPANERALGSQRSFTHAVFEVPVQAYAHLLILHQQQQLVPVLQTAHKEVGPEFLSLPLTVEIIQPGSQVQTNEEWP